MASSQHPVIDSGVVEDLKGKPSETTPQQPQSHHEPSINTQPSATGDQKLPPTHASEISSPPIVAPSAAGQAPDPDEDDLDDLDDMLDEFTTTKISPPTDQTPSSSSKPTTTTLPADTITDKVVEKVASEDGPPLKEDDFAAEFNAQLQKEMAALMSSVDENPETKKQFENMLSQLGLANDEAMASTSSSSSKPKQAPQAQGTKSNEDAFQDTIRRTMERMQASGQSADAAAASSDDDFLSQMLKEMNAEGGEEDFSKMLLSMMQQLTNKEILYEPMKELHDKFPAWIAANEENTNNEDMGRYREQKRLVGEIVGCFEKKGYSDDKTEDREFIVERMQLMQAQGSPPAELVGDMGDPSAALGGMAGAMDGCPQQ